MIAFDNMCVPFSLLRDLPRLTPALLCLFRDEVHDDEDAAGPTPAYIGAAAGGTGGPSPAS